MELNNLLLRKVHVDAASLLLVSDNCVTTLRRCFAGEKERTKREVTKSVLRWVKQAIVGSNVFENPKRKSQLIAFAEIRGKPCWFILELEEDVYVVVSVRLHKDKHYGEELEQVEGET